jgi:hypothetical protein
LLVGDRLSAVAVDAAAEAFHMPATALLGEVREEIEVGIARDLGVLGEELGELRVRAGDVVLVGEEGGVGFYHLDECGTHAEQFDELLAGGGELFVGRWGGRNGDGGRGGFRLRDGEACGGEQEKG